MTGDGRHGKGPDAPDPARRYPVRPVLGVGAVVMTADGRVVLVRRRFEPLAGAWSLPGGGVELGESLETAVRREVAEETGLVIDVGPQLEIFEPVLRDDQGAVRYHYVIVDYLCRATGGQPHAGSDVDALTLAAPDALAPYSLTPAVHRVIATGLTRAAAIGW